MLIIVTGMQREARIVGRDGEVLVAGGDNAGLAARIETAARRGGRAVISIGIGGGLHPGLAVGQAVIATEVVSGSARRDADTSWRDAIATRLPDAVADAIAGSDRIVAEPAAKAALRRASGAVLVDMESHLAAQVAAACGLPFAALRVVSDDAEHALPPAALVAIGSDGGVKAGAVLRSLAARPGQIPGLIRTARDSARAMASLRRCSALLGGGLACPYLG